MDDLHGAHRTTTRAIILAGGSLHTRPRLRDGDLVLAADSGYDHALALGLDVDLLVGDMDSISPHGLAHAENTGVTVERHPTDKDQTDLELAVAAARRLGATDIEIHGADDGRVDHLLVVALSLTSDAGQGTTLSWHTGTGSVRAASATRPVELAGSPGDIVSLIPVGGVTGVNTNGLRWELSDDEFPRGTSRGLSNVLMSRNATISVGSGHLLVVWNGTP